MRNNAISLSIGFAAGILIWMLPPLVTDGREVWDGDYYFVILWMTGLGLGVLFRQRWWLSYLGLVVGHLVAVYGSVFVAEFQHSSRGSGNPGGIDIGIAISIWVPALFVCAYSLWAFAGALMGFGLRYAVKRLRES